MPQPDKEPRIIPNRTRGKEDRAELEACTGEETRPAPCLSLAASFPACQIDAGTRTDLTAGTWVGSSGAGRPEAYSTARVRGGIAATRGGCELGVCYAREVRTW